MPVKLLQQQLLLARTDTLDERVSPEGIRLRVSQPLDRGAKVGPQEGLNRFVNDADVPVFCEENAFDLPFRPCHPRLEQKAYHLKIAGRTEDGGLRGTRSGLQVPRAVCKNIPTYACGHVDRRPHDGVQVGGVRPVAGPDMAFL